MQPVGHELPASPTGCATLGVIDFEGRRDYAAIGGVTNYAARLQAGLSSYVVAPFPGTATAPVPGIGRASGPESRAVNLANSFEYA
jgi:hypothetical protein